VAEVRPREAKGRERWVINKLRALCAWYSRGIDRGSHLRVRINSATSIQELRDIVDEFFLRPESTALRSVLEATDSLTPESALTHDH